MPLRFFVASALLQFSVNKRNTINTDLHTYMVVDIQTCINAFIDSASCTWQMSITTLLRASKLTATLAASRYCSIGSELRGIRSLVTACGQLASCLARPWLILLWMLFLMRGSAGFCWLSLSLSVFFVALWGGVGGQTSECIIWVAKKHQHLNQTTRPSYRESFSDFLARDLAVAWRIYFCWLKLPLLREAFSNL